MAKTYEIIDATIQHPQLGTIAKENIVYKTDGVIDSIEFYSKNGVVLVEIRSGYTNILGETPTEQQVIPNEIDNLTS